MVPVSVNRHLYYCLSSSVKELCNLQTGFLAMQLIYLCDSVGWIAQLAGHQKESLNICSSSPDVPVSTL